MYKLMLVDDEQIVIDAVTHIINKNIKNVTVVASAKNGREAIEKVKANHPEIILMDIRMPGINGIDAITEIKRLYPDIRFAIISAYEQFEFAKQAMELGVEHYILKPINRTALIETIQKMIHQIQEQTEKKRRELETIEKLEKVIPYLEQGFIYSILLNTEFDEELLKYMEILNMNQSGGYIMIMQFGDGEKAEALRNRIGSSIIGHENYPYLRDIFKFKCKCIVGPVFINKIIVYISSEWIENEYEFRLQTIQLAGDILESVQKKMNMECFIGIGSCKRNHEIIISYNEAVKALRLNRGEPISHIFDVCGTEQRDIHDIHETGNLMSKIEMGNEEGAVAAFSKAIDKLLRIQGISFEQRRNFLIEYMVMVHRKAIEAEVCEDSCMKYDDYIQEMLYIDNIEKLISWCMNRIKHITRKIKDGKTKNGNHIINRAKSYIREHFRQELSLEEISRILNISPQYFSRLFKEETGYNFIEYLTFVRIERSKQLMNSTDMTIKEICFSVGYTDPNYFSRLFKKNTGLSPTTYKQEPVKGG
jgi:two-component system response regulator YesN